MSSHEVNPVDSLLKRLNLDKYLSAFREQNITHAKSLKGLSPEDIADIIPHQDDRQRLLDAIAGGDVPHGQPAGRSPATGYPSQEEHQRPLYDNFSSSYADAPRHDGYGDRPRKGGKGGKGKGKGKGGKGGDRDYRYNDEETFGVSSKGGYGGGGGGGKGGKAPPLRSFEREDDYPVDKPNVVEIDVTVPTRTVCFLLASKAHKLSEIHNKYSTHNSRIHPREKTDTTFKVFGPPDAVEKAKEEIEALAGVSKKNKTEQRFQESLLGRTKTITSLLYALNERRLANGELTALPSETIPEQVSHFLFCNPYSHIQQFYIKVNEKPRTKIDLLGKILFAVPTCQTLVFCSNERHVSDLLVKKVKKEQLAGINPDGCWMYPAMGKDAREEVQERFAKGYGPIDKVEYIKEKRDESQKKGDEPEYTEKSRQVGGFATDKNRLLVTTDDFARFARGKPIPYVSLVFCYDVPKTKESYLHRIGCCGRNGKDGVAITLIGPNEMETIDQLTRFGLQIQELPANFHEAIEVSATDELCPP